MHNQDWVKKRDAYVDTQTGTKGGREAEGGMMRGDRGREGERERDDKG